MFSRQKAQSYPRMWKKGIIELQFNWIFVMIVGFLILLFIISIVFSQRKQAENLLNIEVMSQLTASIKGKQQLSDSFSELVIPKTRLYFNCDQKTLLFDYKLEGGQRTTLQNEIIFSPRVLEGNKLSLWTRDFNLPFLVTRFTYISTPDYAFVFYYHNNNPDLRLRTERLMNNSPANLTRFLLSQAQFDNAFKAQHPQYKVICLSDGCAPNGHVNSANHVKIFPDISNNPSVSGNITYRVDSNDQTPLRVQYIGNAALVGAMFSDSRDQYNCTMGRALEQFNIKRNMLRNKLLILQNHLNIANNTVCRDALNTPILALQTMGLQPRLERIGILANNARVIENANKDMNFQSCPYIY
jgi:hypothetical protein